MGYAFGPQQTVSGDFEAINRAHAKAEKWGLGYEDRVPVGAVSLEDAFAAVEPELVRLSRAEQLDEDLAVFAHEAPMALKGMTRSRNSNGHNGLSRTERFVAPKPEVTHPVSDALAEVREKVANQLRAALDYSAWIEMRGFDGTQKPGTIQKQWADYVDSSWDRVHAKGEIVLHDARIQVLQTQPWAKHFGARNGLARPVAEADLKRHSKNFKGGRVKPDPKYAKTA